MTNRRETQGESPEQRLEAVVEVGIERAVAEVAASFAVEGDDGLPYHNTRHTKSVVAKTEALLLAMREGGEQITDREVALGKLAAAYHDIIQVWKPVENEDEGGLSTVMRQRDVGGNEESSADMLAAYAVEVNRSGGEIIFSEEDIDTMRAAIEVTVPGFNGKTVVQEDLTEESHVITRAVALADLGEAGMGGPKEYKEGGDSLFREENLDIRRAIDSGEELSDEQKSAFRDRMLKWTAFQVVFANGRKDRLEEELAGLSESAKTNVRRLFSKFDESIDGAAERSSRRSEMSFTELARDMGYEF